MHKIFEQGLSNLKFWCKALDEKSRFCKSETACIWKRRCNLTLIVYVWFPQCTTSYIASGSFPSGFSQRKQHTLFLEGFRIEETLQNYDKGITVIKVSFSKFQFSFSLWKFRLRIRMLSALRKPKAEILIKELIVYSVSKIIEEISIPFQTTVTDKMIFKPEKPLFDSNLLT